MNMRSTRGKVLKRYGIVLTSNPHPQSPGALTLLVGNLAKQDDTFFSPKKWVRFRRRWLHAYKILHGDIKCKYCGKGKLMVETSDKNKIATIDHVHPVGKGGGLYDLDNLVPACYTCNSRKGDTLLEEMNE